MGSDEKREEDFDKTDENLADTTHTGTTMATNSPVKNCSGANEND